MANISSITYCQNIALVHNCIFFAFILNFCFYTQSNLSREYWSIFIKNF